MSEEGVSIFNLKDPEERQREAEEAADNNVVEAMTQLLASFQSQIAEVKERIQPLAQRISEGELSTENGISLLEVKIREKIEGHQVIDSLIRTRLLLEKLKPLDTKLKYQVDKLLKMASEAENSVDARSALKHIDPKLRHAPNLGSFRQKPKVEDTPKARQEDEAEDKSKQLYVAPRRQAVMYEGAHEKQQREQRRQKQRASGSRMAKLLLEEYSDAPVEETFAGEREKQKKFEEDHTKHEEEYFVRFDKRILKKKSKKQLDRYKSQASELSGLEDWKSLASLGEEISTLQPHQPEEDKQPQKRNYSSHTEHKRKNKRGPQGGKASPAKRHRKK